MIKYKGVCILYQCRGSVFPVSSIIALLCAVVSAGIRWALDDGHLQVLVEHEGMRILRDNSVWSTFTFLVGFLVVFRTSQAYNRFWDGSCAMNQMRAKWYDSCSSIFAFTKASAVGKEATLKFQHLIVRLFSVLHALALADIEDSNKDALEDVAAFRYELVDGGSLDTDTLRAIKQSDAKVELVYQWMQQVVIEGMASGALVIPAPILARSFQELANGLHFFYAAINISTIPFPFPYAQMCECLLLMHWVVTPLVVAQYVKTPWWGAIFTFIIVFVYWSLNAIAVEIENPFGMDANDVDAAAMQDEMNNHLQLLLESSTRASPHLADSVRGSMITTGVFEAQTFQGRASLYELWTGIDSAEGGVRRSARRKFGSLAASTRGRRKTRNAPKVIFKKTTDDNWYVGEQMAHGDAIHEEVSQGADPLEPNEFYSEEGGQCPSHACTIHGGVGEDAGRLDPNEFDAQEEGPLEPPMLPTRSLPTYPVPRMSRWPGELEVGQSRGTVMDVWADEDTPTAFRSSMPPVAVRRSSLQAIAHNALRDEDANSSQNYRSGAKSIASLPPVGEDKSLRPGAPSVVAPRDSRRTGVSFSDSASSADRRLSRKSGSSTRTPRPSGAPRG